MQTSTWSKVPKLVQWMATLDCPHKCKHCYAASTKPFQELDTAEAMGLIDQVAEMGVGEFLVTGGEPTVRDDLPELVLHLRRRSQPWTLNTAIFPRMSLRAAMNCAPPQFVALSLDGTASIHDRFRSRSGSFDETIEAIKYYKTMGCQVGIGTTLTQDNVDSLAELFEIVRRSGADCWGLHQAVPEGRAVGKKSLILRKRQEERLVLFVAESRQQFPVSLTDSFGSCGEFEGMLRDGPVRCGAGRQQCVVLPDGEVVPCTTLDKSTSAGNIRDRSLNEIWTDGFSARRTWTGDGCWLMQRGGKKRQCRRCSDRLIKAAATVLLGVSVAQIPVHANPQPRPPAHLSLGKDPETAIVNWYQSQWNGTAQRVQIDEKTTDKALRFAHDYAAGRFQKKTFDEQVAKVEELASTGTQSLSLCSLLWRSLSETAAEKAPSTRSAKEREQLRRATKRVRKLTTRTCVATAKSGSHPFLPLSVQAIRHVQPEFAVMHRMVMPHDRMILRAQIRLDGDPAIDRDLPLATQLAMKRWASKSRRLTGNSRTIDAMDLVLAPSDRSSVTFAKKSRESEVTAGDIMGIFDTLKTGKQPGVLRVGDAVVKLPADSEVTYVDLLQLVYKQNREQVDKQFLSVIAKSERYTKLRTLYLGAAQSAARSGKIGDRKLTPKEMLTVKRWLVDFWLF